MDESKGWHKKTKTITDSIKEPGSFDLGEDNLCF